MENKTHTLTILGIGNPGKKFIGTPHNVGKEIVHHYGNDHDVMWKSNEGALVGECTVNNTLVRLVVSEVYMNHSGVLVKQGIIPNRRHLIVCHDDLYFPYGESKVAYKRGAAGHNGVQSLIDALGTNEFLRVRVGIAEKKDALPPSTQSYVITPYDESKEKIITSQYIRIRDIFTALTIHSYMEVMNMFNETKKGSE